MNGPSFGKNILLNYIGGIAGSLMVILSVIKIKRIDDYSKIIARNTLFLIFYHWALLVVLGRIGFFKFWSIFDSSLWIVLVQMLYAVIVLYLSVPVIRFLNKNYPVVLGKKK